MRNGWKVAGAVVAAGVLGTFVGLVGNPGHDPARGPVTVAAPVVHARPGCPAGAVRTAGAVIREGRPVFVTSWHCMPVDGMAPGTVRTAAASMLAYCPTGSARVEIDIHPDGSAEPVGSCR